MTSLTTSTSTTFTCLSCDQAVVPSVPHDCESAPKLVPVMPQTVMDAIFNCRRCNPTNFTFYKCNCDTNLPKRRLAMIPPLTLPLAPLPEVEEGTDNFDQIFKFDEDDSGRPNTPEVPLRRRNAMAPEIDSDTLPGDLLSRMAAIEQILKTEKNK